MLFMRMGDTIFHTANTKHSASTYAPRSGASCQLVIVTIRLNLEKKMALSLYSLSSNEPNVKDSPVLII